MKSYVKNPPEKSKISPSDIATDVISVATLLIMVIWSLYVVTLPPDKLLTPFLLNKGVMGVMMSILILNALISCWIMIREILDRRFRFSQYRFLLLLHITIVVLNIIWLSRYRSKEYTQWCLKTYKIFWGFLLGASSLFLLIIITTGPASAHLVKHLQTLYNN